MIEAYAGSFREAQDSGAAAEADSPLVLILDDHELRSLVDDNRARQMAVKIVGKVGSRAYYHTSEPDESGAIRVEFWPMPESADAQATEQVAAVLQGMVPQVPEPAPEEPPVEPPAPSQMPPNPMPWNEPDQPESQPQPDDEKAAEKESDEDEADEDEDEDEEDDKKDTPRLPRGRLPRGRG